MNECHFIGRLVAEPVLEYYAVVNDKNPVLKSKPVPYVRFTLAVSRQHKKKDGSFKDETNFLDFEVWDTAAVTIASQCKVGEILIINRASARSYTTESDGVKTNHTVFRVDKFNFQSTLFGRKKNGQKTKSSVDG